jgi:hypothetical protein
MESTPERRREQRLRYHWPVWFAEDFSGILSQGQMVDVSSGGAAFTCYSDNNCPWPGQHITARFSVPRHQPGNDFDISDFIRSGYICRVDHVNAGLHRVAICFFEPLPFRPGEQANMQLDYEPLAEPALA